MMLLILFSFFQTSSISFAAPVYTQATSEKLVQLALSCVEKEKPNYWERKKKDAKKIHPSFYGCFDWHSAVHSHWSMVFFAKSFPASARVKAIERIISANLTKEKLKKELEYLQANAEYEVPYGLAWYLTLLTEIRKWQHPKAYEWGKSLAQPESLIVKRLSDYFEKLPKPKKTGLHDNSAFALDHMFRYAQAVQNTELLDLVKDKANAYYGESIFCNVEAEPKENDFLSPCLAAASLMAKILPKQTFQKWVQNFFPPGEYQKVTKIVEPKDLQDYQKVHLVGLLFHKSGALSEVANNLPEADPRKKAFLQAAEKHKTKALELIFKTGYGGKHWLASFAFQLAQ